MACRHARQLPHEQPKVEPADVHEVHEQALQDVGMPAQMHPAQPPGLVQMRVGAFELFAPLPWQALPARPPNPPVGHRVADRRFLFSVASTAIRLRDVTAHADGPRDLRHLESSDKTGGRAKRRD